MKRFATLALCLMALSLAHSATVIDHLRGDPTFSSFLTAAGRSSSFMNLLNSGGPITVLAVTNEGVNSANLGKLTDNDAASVLFYHVLPGEITSDRLNDVNFLPSALTDPRFVNLGPNQGQRVMILRDYGAYFVNGYANIIRGDIKCDNGVIHVLGSMIWPSISSASQVAAELKVTAFYDKIVANYMKSIFDGAGVTIFIPTNEAMAEFPERDQRKVLGYHIVRRLYYLSDFQDGQEIKMSNNENVRMVRDDRRLVVIGANGEAQVLTTNYNEAFTRNGVMYRINKVLLSPSFIDPSIKVEATEDPSGTGNQGSGATAPEVTLASAVVVAFSAIALALRN